MRDFEGWVQPGGRRAIKWDGALGSSANSRPGARQLGGGIMLSPRRWRWFSAFVACALTFFGLESEAWSQCNGQWLAGEGIVGADYEVRAAVWWDPDGSGPCPPILV